MNATYGNDRVIQPELVLKTLPPRTPRHLLLRPRLSLDDERFRDRAIAVIQAPPGFGKTSLLAQWRREHLARGAAVAWISADERDDSQRFLTGLVLAIRAGCARPAFGAELLGGTPAAVSELEGVTAWLAEVAQSSFELVLIVDEAERLPQTGMAALTYLLRNAPPNLCVVVAGRGPLEAALGDLGGHAECARLGPESLRFRLEETIALVRERFGEKLETDDCARLHELTDGWPLGLQLALSAVEAGRDPRAVIDALSGRSGNRAEDLVGGLVDRLPAADLDLLIRLATVDVVHPDLCRALTGREQAAEQLARLIRETPFFAASDDSDWCRLHTLASEALRARLSALPVAEQAQLHRRAARWLEAHDLLEEAARHAHDAGDHAAAFELAERCLYDAVQQGRQGVVLQWLALLPEAELDRRPRLRMAGAWALALSERHEEAGRQVERILGPGGGDAGERYECALIVSGAAFYADDPDRYQELFQPWRDAPPASEPRLLQIHANRLAALALLRGDPALARHRDGQLPRGDFGKAHAYAVRWGEFFAGLSYLWEGQVLLAEDVLQGSLAAVQEELGRRHPLACMLAALLAAAVYEQDRVEPAAALLANRLDVLERVGIPETVILAYRTAARIASAQGAEHRALDLLDALHTLGERRQLPRLCVVSLAEQTRLHAARFRSETCRALVRRIDDVLARDGLPPGPLWRRSVELPRALAHAHAAIARQDWGAARGHLERAAPWADALKLHRLRIEIMALRAYATDRLGEDGLALLREAMTLARMLGLARTFVDGHPALAEWARRAGQEPGAAGAAETPVPVARFQSRPPEHRGGELRAVPSMVLTPKEREVLELLARNLSNKEIAQALAVGEETIKWHLKNLFSKLAAASRKHAVRRAQLLGLLEEI